MTLKLTSIKGKIQIQQVGTFIIKKHNGEDSTVYVIALKNANMEQYRLQDSRTTVVFTSGVEVELLSAKELKSAGVNIEVANYKKEFSQGYKMPVFRLADNGYIVALYTSGTKGN
jgi:hypothetical protein